MLMSTREKEIIELLIKYYGQYVTIYEIAQQLGVSSRTIHRELKDIETYLKEFNITLERANKKGIKLSGEDAHFQELKKEMAQHETIDLSVEEQKAIILYALIQSKHAVKQYSLSQEIGVSVQTLTKLLDDLEQDLASYQLTLYRKRGEGVYLDGPESKKREFLSQLMVNNLNSTSVYSVIENHFVYQSLNQSQQALVDLDSIFNIERILMDYLGELPYTLTESSYLTLTVHIVLSIARIQNGEYVSINEEIYDSVKDTFEHRIATEIAKRLESLYDINFNQAEVTFITIHLRGANRRTTSQVFENNEFDDRKIQAFVNRVEHLSGQTFEDYATLVQGLSLHINPAINRLEANIETYNPLTEMIKYKYPRLFDIVHKAIDQTWPELAFPDNEIAFIVLHFGSSLKSQSSQLLHVLVVCSSGIGTSRLLATRLQQSFSEIEKITQASVSDLKMLDLDDYDGIISTVKLDITTPFITVNPLLPESDVTYVASFLKTKEHRPTRQDASDVTYSTIHDPDNIINNMEQGLKLLNSMQIEYKEVTNWNKYLADYFAENGVIAPGSQTSFAELLQNKLNQNPGWVLQPYPVAIPHMKDDLIQRPLILITILNQELGMQSTQNDLFKIKYMISLFIPNNDEMAQLVGELSAELGHHLEQIDDFMQNPDAIKHILRDSFIKRIQNQLT
ncbi:PTS lactose transporter subunit IIB [Staphylococcus devriesei]|uniref:PTS lactose transporter subunit IIB n=1 Tax=Staphylococcus devriesei TaxID=586733 RepID=A0A2T4KLW7_9STAP|nr:BglG family transcription antiterminator [Staphylococcus devriesei]PTF02804.1 PTS lactose transporter subunit IIB [Staphylococcus devriesei]PTF15662.1 PTS lactose transporter subunit IIB [Staphylococcus devriesei]